MASLTSFFVLLVFLVSTYAAQKTTRGSNPVRRSFSASFSLTASSSTAGINYKSAVNYSTTALIVSLPIGTPPQEQKMVLDTGSQLSWVTCNQKPPTTSFDTSLSSSFSVLPCEHAICKLRVPDFTLPTTCDPHKICHYSYFFADGTLAEGNLVKERVSLSDSRTTPPLILGCAASETSAAGQSEGILGMNRGRLSFASQAKVRKFSYCVPGRRTVPAAGTLYLGTNPNSRTFQYVNLSSFPEPQGMPNLDPLAYTVALSGIRIGGKKLNISASVFRPNAGGSGQTIIDSGTEYTFLVDTAYDAVRGEILRRAGAKLKKDYVYQESMDMCFAGNRTEIEQLIGDMVFRFDNGVEIVIGKDRTLEGVGGGILCVGIGRSEVLGVTSNIIGNFHQQNLWVEFDLAGQRVGFGKADCSRGG
ncbi:hypothetical protein DM860_016259 [Cuscuta australis]|uniref:Peptidase A1 domain-containing protein n=1 Tax=Cuscuta australis TaxID=267555 RepID=A0A328E4V9_9ASTE|nr:hypothetical protein DM860_016259 [Cuscuta australis]